MEQKTNNIVVGYDFSLGGRRALEAAARFAEKVGATVHVATSTHGALDPRVLAEMESHLDNDLLQFEDRAALFEKVERLVRDSVSALEVGDVKLVFDVGESAPVSHLLSTAESNRADFFCIGAVGNADPPAGQLVGLDAERLVRRSRYPVMVVHPRSNFPPKKILVPVDFSEASERALGWALDFAHLFGSEVTVVHVVDGSSAAAQEAFGAFATGSYMAAARSLAEREFKTFLDSKDFGDAMVHSLVIQGRPHIEVPHYARENEFDLVVIGSVGRTAFMDALIGGTTGRVLLQAPCSVLAVKPDAFHLRRRASGAFAT